MKELRKKENLALIEFIKKIFMKIMSNKKIFFDFTVLEKLINNKIKIIAFELIWKSWGLGEVAKKSKIGEDKINSIKKTLFLFVNFFTTPTKLNKPEYWTKVPNCSAPKKKPRE